MKTALQIHEDFMTKGPSIRSLRVMTKSLFTLQGAEKRIERREYKAKIVENTGVYI
jgi:hypothetical protein